MGSERDEVLTVALPAGNVTVSAAYGRHPDTWATMVIAHGAGTTFAHPFLIGFAEAMRAEGIATLRFNFAYSEAGRRMPGPAAHAISAWTAAMAAAVAWGAGEPVWAAGRSYGGRMASMAAAEGAIAPAGLVYLGYPLHPPGRPDAPRVAHLRAVRAPQLFVSGLTDAFVDPHDQLEAAVASCHDATLEWVAGGHSFEVTGRRRPAAAIGADLAPLVAAFVRARSSSLTAQRARDAT